MRKIFEKRLTEGLRVCIILTRRWKKTCSEFDIGELCNGSTTDSDSVCWGSNPYSAAKKTDHDFMVCFSLSLYGCKERTN